MYCADYGLSGAVSPDLLQGAVVAFVSASCDLPIKVTLYAVRLASDDKSHVGLGLVSCHAVTGLKCMACHASDLHT